MAPEIVAKKIPRANIQQAFVFDTVIHFAGQFMAPRVLCVGSFEDSAAASLKKAGIQFAEIDPVVNQLDLDKFSKLPTSKPETYDIVFSTSVMEHVEDDLKFLKQITELLAPGGVCVLTVDFKEGYRVGDPLIGGDYRFYTKQDLLEKVAGLAGCDLVDPPQWDCPDPDFELCGFKYTFATVVFRKRATPAFAVAWDKMTGSEQVRFYNENGFLLVPGALSPDEVKQAIREIGECGLRGTTEEIWRAPFARALVTNPKLLSALGEIFGKDIRFFKAAYAETPSEKDTQVTKVRRTLHQDYGIGEKEGDPRNSTASWVNVAFYLTDLTAKHAPLWVVPGSNRMYQFVPFSNFEFLADQAKMVLARAGDAVLFHCSTVHAASNNLSGEMRRALFYSYRPAWAKPAGIVPEWPSEFVESFPSEHQGLFRNLNVGL